MKTVHLLCVNKFSNYIKGIRIFEELQMFTFEKRILISIGDSFDSQGLSGAWKILNHFCCSILLEN